MFADNPHVSPVFFLVIHPKPLATLARPFSTPFSLTLRSAALWIETLVHVFAHFIILPRFSMSVMFASSPEDNFIRRLLYRRHSTLFLSVFVL